MKIVKDEYSVKLWLSSNDTYNWANKSGASWPCSTLENHRVFAEFDKNGLCDLAIDGKSPSRIEIDGTEFDAMTNDFLAMKGYNKFNEILRKGERQ